MKIFLIIAIIFVLSIAVWEITKLAVRCLVKFALMIYNSTPMGEKALAIRAEQKIKYWVDMCREIKE